MTAMPARAFARETDTRGFDLSADRDTLYRDGIVGLKGAFSRDWAESMREDMMTAFWEAIRRPGGAVGRGPASMSRSIRRPSAASSTS